MRADENNRTALLTGFVRSCLRDLLLAASIRFLIGLTLLFGATFAAPHAAIGSCTPEPAAFGTAQIVDSTNVTTAFPTPPPLGFTVNTTSDAGDSVINGVCETSPGNGRCTLRAAIQEANAHPGARINFNIPTTDPGYSNGTWTIILFSALPDLNAAMTITGPGANALTVSGNIKFRVFGVTTTGTVTLSGLTIANGFETVSDFAGGGGIHNDNSGRVNVTNCTFSNNYGIQGGGVYNNKNGTMNITNCTFRGNFPEFGGGAYNSGTMNIANCTLSGNDGGSGGGAISNVFGMLLVTGSTINGNLAGATADNSESGGGIENYGGTLTVTNSTISGNQAYFGGGIFNSAGGTVTITGSTITNNSAILEDSGQGSEGGGIFSYPLDGSLVDLKSSIIALNTATYSGNLDGSFVSHGFNLIGTNYGAVTYFPAGNPNANNDIVGTSSSPVNPMLDANGLQNNGGLTQTIALLPGSPAIDKGNSTTAGGFHLTVDQRGVGYARTINKSVPNATGGDGTDIGAFELGAQIKAVSRKAHGTAGMFDIKLPLFGPKVGVECRKGGSSHVFKVIVTFPTAVSVGSVSVTPDPKAPGATGSVSSASVSGRVVTVNLTEVSNAQTILVDLFDVSDGTSTNDVRIPMGVLFGDTNNNKSVSSTDVSLTQSKVGQALSATNFREDVDLNGAINSTDVQTVQSKVGTKLP